MTKTSILQGFFVDSDGVVQNLARPAPGQSYRVVGDVVQVLGLYVEGDGAEVLAEYSYYASLDALRALGIEPNSSGKAVLSPSYRSTRNTK